MSLRPRTIADRLSRDAVAAFVGGDQELIQLKSAIVAPALPFVVGYVYGRGGVGKSSFVREVCGRAGSGVRKVILDFRNLEPMPGGFLACLDGARAAASDT